MFCLVRSNLPMCTNSFTWCDWQFLKAIAQSPWIAFWKCGRMLFSVYVHHRFLAKGSLLVWKTREVWMALWWKFSHAALQVRNIKCALCSVINLLSSNKMSFVETITTNHNWSRAWINYDDSDDLNSETSDFEPLPDPNHCDPLFPCSEHGNTLISSDSHPGSLDDLMPAQSASQSSPGSIN